MEKKIVKENDYDDGAADEARPALTKEEVNGLWRKLGGRDGFYRRSFAESRARTGYRAMYLKTHYPAEFKRAVREYRVRQARLAPCKY